MYTCADIKLQNQQDAFSAMFMFVSREILNLCGVRTGEGIIREAVRRAGRDRGFFQLQWLKDNGQKTDLQHLYLPEQGCAADPRRRYQRFFDETDRQIWEVYSCPMADFWRNQQEERIGSFFCEEYMYSCVQSYTNGVGQLNLSKVLTNPRDNFCCFSAYFRQANMSIEREKEALMTSDDADSSFSNQPYLSFEDHIHTLTISVYYYLLKVAEERYGREGVNAICEGLKKWQLQAIDFLKRKAVYTSQKLDNTFLSENFPLPLVSEEDSFWNQYSGHNARDLMQRLVLSPIKSEEV